MSDFYKPVKRNGVHPALIRLDTVVVVWIEDETRLRVETAVKTVLNTWWRRLVGCGKFMEVETVNSTPFTEYGVHVRIDGVSIAIARRLSLEGANALLDDLHHRLDSLNTNISDSRIASEEPA